MKVYAVEFKASLTVAAEDENQAAGIARSAIFQEPKLIYVEAVTASDWRSSRPVVITTETIEAKE